MKYEAQHAAYLVFYHHVELERFAKPYDRDDLFSAPNVKVKLGLFATNLFGLSDAALYTMGTIFTAGPAGVIRFATVLALSAGPLWRSRRPARTLLKFLVWPTLASALVWGAILIMAVSAAVFGGLTPNTSAHALLATLPLLFVLAKLPLHLAEILVNRTTSAPWDGVDRRKPRPPAGAVPPLGGA